MQTYRRNTRTSVYIKMEFTTLQLIYSESYIHHENFKLLYYVPVLVLVYFIAHSYCVQEFAPFGLQTQTPWYSCSLYTECPQEECARLREGVPYVKVHRYNPKHLYPKLNGYGDNDQRKVWSSCGSTYCSCSADALLVRCACPSLNVKWVNLATALRMVVSSCKNAQSAYCWLVMCHVKCLKH
jgi:hypothetical protein